MIDQLNLALWAWIESIRGARQFRTWAPFLVLILLQGLLLVLLTFFYEPLTAWFAVPFVQAAASEQALHYPQFFLVLPGIFSRAGVWLDWLVGSLLYGAAFLLIWRAAAGQPVEGSWAQAGRSYGKLLLVRVPPILFALFLLFVLPAILPGGEGGIRGNRLRLLRYGSFAFGVTIEALFVYAPLAVVVLGRPAGRAIRDSFTMLARVPLTTFLIVLVPNLVQVPVSAVLRRSDSVVRSLAPEVVVWLVAGSILVYAVINYFILASAVRVFGTRAEALEGGTS